MPLTLIVRRLRDAWITLVRGNSDEALLRLMRGAADSRLMEKHIVMPGAIMHAREFPGGMPREATRPAEALAAYMTHRPRAGRDPDEATPISRRESVMI
jgi:hypothetical protein